MNLRVARVSTVKFAIYTQLYAQLEIIESAKMDLTVISSEDDSLIGNQYELNEFDFIGVNIPRNISPIRDFLALLRLVKIFRREQFDVVHSTTPKAGLLCAIAGRIAGVKVRMHTFTGQPWATMTGLKRLLLRLCDKIIGYLNTCCYADSISQKKFLIDNGIGTDNQLIVLGKGSLAGVNSTRFNPMLFLDSDKKQLRSELNIPEKSQIILFVGRITLEKGVSELLEAFESIVSKGLDVYLLLVGPFEPDGKQCLDKISNVKVNKCIRTVGFTSQPEKYMAISDVLCLPSYREGFGTVVIEAAVMGLPAITTDIYGLSDAVVDGETGLLVPVRNYNLLATALVHTLENNNFRLEMAFKARERALEFFDSSKIGELVVEEYKKYSKH